jgi:hypothetical protein
MQNNVIGKWRLIEMEQWDQEFIDLVEPGFISFQKGGRQGRLVGHFKFHQGDKSGFIGERWKAA